MLCWSDFFVLFIKEPIYHCTLTLIAVSSSLSSKLLLSLVYDLLRGSAMCQQQFLQSQGFMIIGHVLEKVGLSAMGSASKSFSFHPLFYVL